MEAVAVRLTDLEGWTYLGGASGKKPAECVVRAFDGGVLAAIGESEDGPTGEPVSIPEGEGRRLEGHHFFARPAGRRPATITTRGI